MQLKAAIFDMDGTLVNSLLLWDVFWAEFGRRFGRGSDFRPTREDDKAVRTMTVADALNMVHEKYALGDSGETLLRIANATMVDFYAHRVELKPGVREFLDALQAQGVKMCVASATAPDLIDLAMDHCGLRPYFSRVFSCTEVGKGKDAPDIFLLAQKWLGESIEDTCVFEDSLLAIETAKKTGMQTVAIYDQYNFGQERMREIADHYIAKDETLMKLLEESHD